MQKCSALLLRQARHQYRAGASIAACSRIAITRSAPRSAQFATQSIRGKENDHEASSNLSKTLQQQDIKPDELIQQVIARLPARFQADDAFSTLPDPDSASSAEELGHLLLAGASAQPSVDVLSSLALKRGQWKAAVWIAQRLLETSHSKTSYDLELSQLVERRPSIDLHSETSQAIEHKVTDPPLEPVNIESLLRREDVLQPNSAAQFYNPVLGCIWHSLGLMTLACAQDKSVANGFMKPEILEILALFHHHGFMPESVYAYVPSDQPDAVQQPATLYLLSQRVMVALSDAAWRGRESAALETTGDAKSTRLERLGSSVRANIEAVKPEMWLELILWSCLHGGWADIGAQILLEVSRQTTSWKPMSWRRVLREHFGIVHAQEVNWNELLTASSYTRKAANDFDVVQVERTLSSELIDAYVQALVDLGIDRVVSPAWILECLETLRNFLRRNSLNLHSGTWDSIILRMVENDASLLNRPDMMERCVRLSATMGDELTSVDKQVKPRHVLAGNAALLGLLHHALQVQISGGTLTGALQILNLIRDRVSNTVQRSIEDFFHSRLLDDMYEPTSNYVPLQEFSWQKYFHGVEHPSFQHQIPLATLSALIDLITRYEAFALGKALINEQGADGQILDRAKFGHPRMASALIRFATATSDEELLAQVLDARYQYIVGRALEASQLDAFVSSTLSESIFRMQWQTARGIVSHMARRPRTLLDTQCLADLGSVCLKLEQESSDGARSFELFEAMTIGKYAPDKRLQPELADQQANVVGLLSTVDERFVPLARQLIRQDHFSPPSSASFNSILNAVAVTKGSGAARSLLDTFRTKTEGWSNGRPIWHPFHVEDVSGHQLTVGNQLEHSLTDYIIVLKAALQELKRQTAAPIQELDEPTAEIVEWAARALINDEDQAVKLRTKDVQDELQRLLEELGMQSLRIDVSDMLT